MEGLSWDNMSKKFDNASDLYDVIDPGSPSPWPFMLNALFQTPMHVADLIRLGKSFYRALAALKKGWRIQMAHGSITHLTLRQHHVGDIG